jgi:hypothetical protein
MKKISFKFEEQVSEDTWKLSNSVDDMKLETTLTDTKDLLSLVQEEIDEKWNSRLRAHENPRRATEIVKVEEYVPPVKYTFNDDEDDDYSILDEYLDEFDDDY